MLSFGRHEGRTRLWQLRFNVCCTQVLWPSWVFLPDPAKLLLAYAKSLQNLDLKAEL